ncbi:MAG TPA: hypothetical protein VNF51_02205 [Candidatus Paceibacterota bacterium]|nr:hypothetical protein [Candidatus Paceibacterota bacterium]
MDKPNHHEHPELWFRPSPAMPLPALLSLIEKEEITETLRLGRRDGAHQKGYIPGTVATLRLFDADWQERLHKRIRVTNVVSKSLHEFPNWQSVQQELSFFENRPIALDEIVSIVEFSFPGKERRGIMNILDQLNRIAENNIPDLSGPFSVIIGEHPSAYAVSPRMWNKEIELRGVEGHFFPIDIPFERKDDLTVLLNVAFAAGPEYFRVLTITNPYKIHALEYFRAQAKKFPGRVVISADAERIGATNQILIGPDSIFNVINSDGQGMVNAIQTYFVEMGGKNLADKRIGIIGAGGAARGIIYELMKLTGTGKGSIALFNRTVEKAEALILEFKRFFSGAKITVHPLADLPRLATGHDVLVSSITDGDPLFEHNVYRTLIPGTLIVDANYGEKSVLEKHADTQASDKDLAVRDGSGMVVEGYIIPSQALAKLWGYEVPFTVYEEIGALFNYKPRK